MQSRFVFVAAALVTLASGNIASDLPAGTATRTRSNPLVAYGLDESERHWFEGVVVSRLAAGQYVYLRLRDATGAETWFVSLAATTPAAARVRALAIGRAEHFHSRRLDRDFSPLLFAAVRSAAP
jgi:hypothetical protein